MLLHFLVASVQAGPRSKNIELGLRFSSQFNQELAASDQALAAFCFPLGAEAQAPKEYMASEEYTFTLTKSDGSRFSGFCRRFLPPAPKQGPKLRYARVICLITEAPWFAFFSKVLQTLEQLIKQSELLDARNITQLPENSAAGQFLKELAKRLNTTPQLGSIIRVPVPPDVSLSAFSPPKKGNAAASYPLTSPDAELELHVPQDCGNGSWNAGVSMARLLYHVPIPAMLTLIASMLLERRIILVGQSRDMVSAAVHAANAFLYPFQWHHIFLPLLPKHFKDYLTAPMPFLVGMPAQLLPLLKGIPMNEVTMIDLDLAKCEPVPGSKNDDALLLPWRDRLELALHTAYSQLRSPTEYESNPLITGIMQEYFLKLVGSYRKFVTEIDPGERAAAGRRNDDDILYGDGMRFDHGAFISSFRGLERAKNFLRMFRHSQMYEVFIQERLQLAQSNYVTDDIFECKVLLAMERRSRVQEMSSKVQAKYAKTVNKLGAILRKHTRNTSADASGELVAFGPRNLPKVHTDPSAALFDRITSSGASTPASASSHHVPALVDLHQLFETESDAESEMSAFSNAWGRHSDSGTSDLDRVSAGPTRAESSASMDPDNSWRGMNGFSSTASTPKPIQVSNLISLDEENPPGPRPPDIPSGQLEPSDPVPNLVPAPRTNPFASTTTQPPPLRPPPSYLAHSNPSIPQAKQPTATARFISILDAALSSAAVDPRQGAPERPPAGMHPLTPSASQNQRTSRDSTFGSMLASYGKDAWSELTSVARDVRESVREARQNLGKTGYAQSSLASPCPTPCSTAPPSRRMSFNNLTAAVGQANASEAGQQQKVPAPVPDKSPSHKLVDDFLSSSMVTLGLTPGSKTSQPQPGPSLQQLRSQSSLDVVAQQAALAAEHRSLSRTTSAASTQVASVVLAAPSASTIQLTTMSSAPAPNWDPFDFLASSAPQPKPSIPQQSATAPPLAPSTANTTPGTWDPFSEAIKESTCSSTLPGPAVPQLSCPPTVTALPSPSTSVTSPLSFAPLTSSSIPAAPVSIPFNAIPMQTQGISASQATATTARHSIDDPFAALVSSRPGAALTMRSAPPGQHRTGAPVFVHQSMQVEVPRLI